MPEDDRQDDKRQQTRRSLLFASTGAALLLGGCTKATKKPAAAESSTDDFDYQSITATEYLTYEHGILRRILLAYQTAAGHLQTDASVAVAAIAKAASLFRNFCEDYHERQVEESLLLPVVRKLEGEVAKYPDILLAQHERGRQLTDYILRLTAGTKSDWLKLPATIGATVTMFQQHTAREDTVVFPEWKKTLSDHDFDAISDHFEEIQERHFGQDGYAGALKQIVLIEADLGMTNLAQFTAPAPSPDHSPKKS